MFPIIRQSLIFLGFIGTISGVCFGVETDGFEKYQTLIQKNPFLPKSDGLKPVLKKSETGNYRFTGFVVRGEYVRVGIENITSNRSYLMAAGEKIEEDPSHMVLAIKEINVKEKYVTINANGESLRLDLSESMAPMAMMNSPPPDMAPASNIEGGGDAAPRPMRRRILVPTRN